MRPMQTQPPSTLFGTLPLTSDVAGASDGHLAQDVFSAKPQSLDAAVDQVVGKVLQTLDLGGLCLAPRDGGQN